MKDFLKKIIGDKREWKAMQARAKALPRDYQIVYSEILQYVWGSAWLADDPTDIFKGLLELFEEGVTNGKRVLEITGEDVAAFCDELLQGEKTHIAKCREVLNNKISKKLSRKY